MKGRLKQGLIFAVVIVLGYFNYYKDEKSLGVIENIIETTKVEYFTAGYKIEAESQIDDMDLSSTKFLNATAKYEDLSLKGGKVFLDAGKNLFLEENIRGENEDGWKLLANTLSYNQYKDILSSDTGIEVNNLEKNLSIYSKNISTDKDFEKIEMEDDIKVSDGKILLEGDKGKYIDETKIFTLQGNGNFKSLDENDDFHGEYVAIKYLVGEDKLEMKDGFTAYFENSTLKGKNLYYDNKDKTFTSTNNPTILIDGYTIKATEIKKIGSENIVDIVGRITGENEELDFVADKGVYNADTKKLYLTGNVELLSKKGELLKGEIVVYDSITKIVEITAGKKEVTYAYEDTKAQSSKIIYDYNTKNIQLYKGYIYEDEIYISQGEDFVFNNEEKTGKITKGVVYEKERSRGLRGDTINFNTLTENYKASGNVILDTETNTLTTNEVEYINSEDKGRIIGNFILSNKENGTILEGSNGEYKISTNTLLTTDPFVFKLKTGEVTGKGISYNSKNETGEILSDIVYIDKNKNILSGDKGRFKNKEYFIISENVKIKTETEEFITMEAIYNLTKDEIEFNHEINFKNLDNTFSGKLTSGILKENEEVFIGNNFSGKTDKEEEVSSEILEYSLGERKAKLIENVILSSKEGIVKSDELEYDSENNIISAKGNITVKSKAYGNVAGEKLIMNTETKDIEGEKIKITSNSLEEELSADLLKGNIDKMTFTFKRNVKGNFKSAEGTLTRLSGEEIEIVFAKKETEYDITRVIGEKNTRVENDEYLLVSDDLDYNFLTGELLGNKNNIVTIANKESKVNIKGDHLEGNIHKGQMKANRGIYIENIDTTGEKIILIGDKGEIDINTLDVEITSNVSLENSELIFRADRMIYNKETEKLKAFGKTDITYKVTSEENKEGSTKE